MHINLKNSFFSLFIALALLIVITLCSCKSASSIEIESFKIYTANSEIADSDNIKFEIILSGVNKHDVKSFEITKDSDKYSCEAEKVIGKENQFYTTLTDFSYNQGDKYYLTAIKYDDTEKEFDISLINTITMPAITNTVAKMELQSLSLNSENANDNGTYNFGTEIKNIEVKIENGDKYDARYLAYTFYIPTKNNETFETQVKTSYLKNKVGVTDTYYIDVTLPTLEEVISTLSKDTYEYKLDSTFICGLKIKNIVYGAKNSTIDITSNHKIEIQKSIFEILNADEFQPHFSKNATNVYTDVNNNALAQKGTQIILVPDSNTDGIMLKFNGNEDDFLKIKSITLDINGQTVTPNFQKKDGNIFQCFDLKTLTLNETDPRGIVVNSISYELGNKKFTIENTQTDSIGQKLPLLQYTNTYMFTYLIETVEDLKIENFEYYTVDNTLTNCSLIFLNSFNFNNSKVDLSNTILNGNYSFGEGCLLEGNGKSLTLTTEKPLFNNVSGIIRNLRLNGNYIRHNDSNYIENSINDKMYFNPIFANTVGDYGNIYNIDFRGNIETDEITALDDAELFLSFVKNNSGNIHDILFEPESYLNSIQGQKYLYMAYSNSINGELRNIIYKIEPKLNDFLFENQYNIKFSAGSKNNEGKELNLFVHINSVTFETIKKMAIYHIEIDSNSYFNANAKSLFKQFKEMLNQSENFITDEEYNAIIANQGFWADAYAIANNEYVNLNDLPFTTLWGKLMKTFFKDTTLKYYIEEMSYAPITKTALENIGFLTNDTGYENAFWNFNNDIALEYVRKTV